MAQLSILAPSVYADRKFNSSKASSLEITYEITSHLPGMPFGVAFADIVESARHLHETPTKPVSTSTDRRCASSWATIATRTFSMPVKLSKFP